MYGRDTSRPWVRDMIHLLSVRGSLATRGRSHAGAKNGDCHQFAPHHGHRKKAFLGTGTWSNPLRTTNPQPWSGDSKLPRCRHGACPHDGHQFAPRHGPRNKALSLKRIGRLYPIFRDLHFHHGLLGVLLLLFAICLPLPAGETVSIELERDRLTAADLARVIPQWKKLDGSRVIAYAPLPGVERRVSRRQLIRWADQQGLKLNIEELPEAVLLARRMRKLGADEALRTVAGAVSERYQLPLEQLRVRLHGFSETLVPAGKLSFEIRGSLNRLNQPVSIPLSWRDSDGRSGTTPLRASVSILGAYAAARHAIPAKSIVGPDDFVFREGILPGPPDKYLVLPEYVEGKTLKYSLKSGQALSRAMLLDTPLVQRGDLIELALRSKSIRLRAPARAEEAGSLGDRIACRNLESGRRVVATIVGQKRAEVTFIP